MSYSNDLERALNEEKRILEESRDISEISDQDKSLMRSLLKEEFI